MSETKTKLTEADFDPIDAEALNRALKMTLEGKDRGRARQVRSFLAEDDGDPDHGWWYAASFAASARQSEALNLKCWEEPPCDLNFDDVDHLNAIIAQSEAQSAIGSLLHNNCGAAKLLKRMLGHGLSQYEPDPVGAIAAKQRK